MTLWPLSAEDRNPCGSHTEADMHGTLLCFPSLCLILDFFSLPTFAAPMSTDTLSLFFQRSYGSSQLFPFSMNFRFPTSISSIRFLPLTIRFHSTYSSSQAHSISGSPSSSLIRLSDNVNSAVFVLAFSFILFSLLSVPQPHDNVSFHTWIGLLNRHASICSRICSTPNSTNQFQPRFFATLMAEFKFRDSDCVRYQYSSTGYRTPTPFHFEFEPDRRG
ncbi:hypothetical protein K438DRAFT_749850 [Mycena galopus ATCC 62051]|nr:hypothetical protein K438DRAFT_749850 [Mycena galopus ATCC 62051]